VVTTFRQPLDILAKTAMAAAHFEADETAKSSKAEIWLMTQSKANPSQLEIS
jgi:hypothetical protein